MAIGAKVIDLPLHVDARGRLTVFEGGMEVPFQIKRVFVISDVPRHSVRGQHAHRRCQQVLVAVAGGVTVRANDAQDYRLSRSENALYLPAGAFVEMRDWTPDAVLMVLASERYDPEDYVRRDE